MEKNQHRNSSYGFLVMITLSVCLFWLPIFGPFLAGFFAARRSGQLEKAIVVAFACSVVVGGVLFLLAADLATVPLIGIVARAGGPILFLIQICASLVGAILGSFPAKSAGHT